MKLVTLFVCISCALRLAAQDAGDMDALIETPAVSGAQAARFVLGAAGLLPAGLSGAEAETAAWEEARARGWAGGGGSAALSLKDAAFLVMGAFGFKGGLMYSLFPGPRYAYRELLQLRIIQGRADENFTVSGERLLHIIAQALRYSGEDGRMDAALLLASPKGLLPYREEFEVE
jgi:hypothetical protein